MNWLTACNPQLPISVAMTNNYKVVCTFLPVIRGKKLIDFTNFESHPIHLELLCINALNIRPSPEGTGNQFMSELPDRIDRLNEIGIALSAETDTAKLLELIMMGAKSLTHADGGLVYFLQDGELSFEIISNDSLDIQMGGTSSSEISVPPIPLVVDGNENHSNVVTHFVLTGETINIADAYNEDGFDFTGARDFDSNTGYRTRAMLTFPLKKEDHIDPDIFDIFFKNRVYLDYAEEFLEPEQIDEIDVAVIQGYSG